MLGNFRIGTKIGISFAVALSVLTGLGIVAYQATYNLIENSKLQAHTYQVIIQIQKLVSQINDAEVSQRGYLITNEKRTLEAYENSLPLINKSIEDLKKITEDNKNQQRRSEALEPIINKRLDVIKNRISILETEGFESVKRSIQTDEGRALTDKIRQILGEMELEENQLLKSRTQKTEVATRRALNTIIFGIPSAFLLLILIGIYLNRDISDPLSEIYAATKKLAAGDLSVKMSVDGRRDEIGKLKQIFNLMINNLRETTQRNQEQNWLKSNQARFTQILQGERQLETVARIILKELVTVVSAQLGVFYAVSVVDGEKVLKLMGSYAYQKRKNLGNQFAFGEGLVGQCALEKQKIILTDVPDDYIQINSGLGAAKPVNIVVSPVLFENEVIAVLELASFQSFGEMELLFLDEVTETMGIVLNAIASDKRTQELLQESQALTQQLQLRQQELQNANQLLGDQTNTLQQSGELLRQQQQELQQSNEELQQLNEELEEKAQLLVLQKKEVEGKNSALEVAKISLEEQALQLQRSSQYKSEFLANMSHELRTPLNSLLILAKLLSDNNQDNLTPKQVEYSQTIYSAGTELLELINDILDLAKIESGTLSLELQSFNLNQIEDNLERIFTQVAQNKNVDFSISLDPNLPPFINTDVKRLQQILINLLGNAFKFTENGEVSLIVNLATQGWNPQQGKLNSADKVISFAIKDTGVGIPVEKQKIIFEAFQQADGSTSRKYGGTGLGLSISREIARLFGGEITLESQLGVGSTFTFYLPLLPQSLEVSNQELVTTNQDLMSRNQDSIINIIRPSIQDDRNNFQSQKLSLLIIEDDINFAKILIDTARQYGFQCIHAQNGSDGLKFAQQFQASAIFLDIGLSGIDGWTVLDRLKHDSKTRHIPVNVMTVSEEKQRSLEFGAYGYLQKPISMAQISDNLVKIKSFIERPVKKLLVVEDDPTQRQSIIELIGGNDVVITAVETGQQALIEITNEAFDCMVLDLGLSDIEDLQLIEQIKEKENGEALPIIIYTGREISKTQETQLKRMAETIIIKDVRSPERLLDETALFLHRVQAHLPVPKQNIIKQVQANDSTLTDKKILIIDDDMRNIFALTSVLERYQMQVLYAENGREGIEVLTNNPDVNIVLMDVMMPEMDGYETTRQLRQKQQFQTLPIIALTAKAMPGDREKCLEAGASDYITKPVDIEQLISLLRVWLYQR
ncbi:response regulator [Calothrix sp. PCC 6303]|uniref:response regulator n=1 Tax=Calothrix sp. PCC 6303 TaxID=1170562 RepID=UPI0002A00638|nr:response regulator [Calothrix sp. PCC 6303]AFZ02831.1 multi-sensor hybrid histidine kinase [Calothrix sp. PCC 6303]